MPRLVDPYLTELTTTFPAVLLTGPRATGKTTTAVRYADTVIRLDRADQAEAFRAAPDAVLAAQHGRVVLDEWQEVPQLLGAVKRAVDEGAPPGRFLLTGSVRAPLTTAMWPGTGRLLHVSMYPLVMAERTFAVAGALRTVVDLMVAGRAAEIRLPAEVPDLPGYLELAVAGGYPEIIAAAPRARRLWLASYLEQLFVRDVVALTERPDPSRMRRFLEATTAGTAGMLSDTELARTADINVKTARVYQGLLQDLGIVQAVPAWFSNRFSRLVKAPKRYIVDPGLAAAVLGVDVPGVLANADLLGRLLDTFVAAQIRPLLTPRDDGARMHHLRQHDGRREVDLLVEFSDGRVLGLEIKASAAPKKQDARHLEWLRDGLGDRFAAGVVLHTGPLAYPLADRVDAVPIAALWGGTHRGQTTRPHP